VIVPKSEDNIHTIKLKYLTTVVLFSLITIFAQGNAAPLRAFISEILASESGTWTIEMGFYAYHLVYIDSIRLETSSGSSIILYFPVIPGGGLPGFDSLALITQNNLASPVSIDPYGDIVKLIRI
jgi:hypothetical protein